jgi:hypothetical protein
LTSYSLQLLKEKTTRNQGTKEDRNDGKINHQEIAEIINHNHGVKKGNIIDQCKR